MSVITFSNHDKREVGQTLSVAAIATCMALEHNYKILVISADFNDKTLENCFFRPSRVSRNISSMFGRGNASTDVANGVEGLIRLFASNRVEADMLGSYTRPVFRDRLDVLSALKTKDPKEYANLSVYFSQIAEVASKVYDLVLVDADKLMPLENAKKLYGVSSVVVMGLAQNQESINDFKELKLEDEFYKRNSVIINLGRYNRESKFSAKNIGRELRESTIPFTIPYNIRFSDACAENRITDYFIKTQKTTFKDGEEYLFYQAVKDDVERLDNLRRNIEFGVQK